MPGQRFRVGIVGLQPRRSWAARAHVPALRALPDRYEIVGVANTGAASAEAARAAMGLPRAFASVAELVASPEIDVVTVAVRVPHHLEVVKAALAAGKHVYCAGRSATAWPRPRSSPRSPAPRACSAWSGPRRAWPRRSSTWGT